MLRYIATTLLLLLSVSLMTATDSDDIDILLSRLDSVINSREEFIKEREQTITGYKIQLTNAASDSIRYHILGRLFDTYNPFNTDSAYYYSKQKEEVAKQMGNPSYILDSKLNQANVLTAVGMYHEASQILNSIHSHDLPDYLVPYYYHIKRTLAGLLADYSAFSTLRAKYNALTNAYRDSLMSVNDPSSFAYAISRADQFNSYGQYENAVKAMKEYMASHELSEHDIAICAWTLAESYGHLGDIENQKRQLLISSIGDMKAAVREYVSLRELAMLLYKEGDLERAYKFMNIAVDDATKCNARIRIVELNNSYPQLTGIYVDKVKAQQKRLLWAFSAIMALFIFLVITLLYLRKQMKIIDRSKQELANANNHLENLNSELQDSNKKLTDANRSIAENSRLKETYIGRYMDQCLSYIDNLDTYRKGLLKLASAGKTDEMKRQLKSSDTVDSELKTFYDNFDKTFLSLFPSFVEDFNSLLMPEEKIMPKKEGGLNTELRIFALIRLGINDSDSIAKFLRYSLTTIYNYRTKVRNKAAGDRNKLEAEVMKIGVADK